MSLRPSQLPLRLDPALPQESQSWQDGAAVLFLGRCLRLRLDTSVEDTTRLGDELHVPVPPQASPRQVQDRAEAWLRREGEQFFVALIARRCALNRSVPPGVKLSFATRSGWVEIEPGRKAGKSRADLRINWRLIELAPEVIEQVIGRALASVCASEATADLFAGPAPLLGL